VPATLDDLLIWVALGMAYSAPMLVIGIGLVLNVRRPASLSSS
jgi:hypothetical protein